MDHSSGAAIGKDPGDENADMPAREAYLSALTHFWPELLQELRDEVASKYAHLFKDMPTPQNSVGRVLEEMARVEIAEAEIRSGKPLRLWARAYRICDAWIQDAAVSTISWYCRKGELNSNWIWIPKLRSEDFQFGHFSLVLDEWWRLSEPWESFRERVRSQLDLRLSEHRRKCQKQRGVSRKTAQVRDAGWTVRYQKGELAKSIAAELHRGYKDPEQVVNRAIERFAKSIRLTLRSSR